MIITKSIIKDIIISNEEFIDRNIMKIVPREDIYPPESLNKAVIFYGVRRSGKTFILYDFFKRYRDRSLYIDFEDERLAGFELKDFELLRSSFLELKPELINRETVFLLDEIQHVAGWEKFCRRAVERENIKVFLSGSASRMMPFEIHTALRGRAWSMEVLPFSFKEYLGARNMDVHDNGLVHGTKSILVKNHFSEYLRWGGFPEVSLMESEFEKIKLLREYFSAMFFRDLIERFAIKNIPLLESLTDKLFSSFATKLSLNSFYKQYKDKFPFSKDMLFKYYKDIIQSMLVFEVRKFSESTYKRMRNPAKIYTVDPGLCKRVSSTDTGRLLENAVFLELKRRGTEVFYFGGNKECDFVTKSPDNKFMAIQATFELNEQNTEREIGGLVEACEFLDIKEGTLITYDEENELKAGVIKINVIPAWKWMIT